MKLKIKPYLLRLIKENILYIVSIVFLVILIVFVSKFSVDRLIESNKKTKLLKADIIELEKKVKLYQTSIPSSDKLDEDINLLNSLIPNIEDYFSVIYSLEKLSQKTGFLIVDYSVNIQKSTTNKLRLIVTGMGDSVSFLKFLEDYKFGGGRLITSDKIELNSQISESIKLDLTFYNKSANLNSKDVAITDGKIFEELETIKQKVSFDFNQNLPVEELDTVYPRKNNPF